jgi:hypothetical protein
MAHVIFLLTAETDKPILMLKQRQRLMERLFRAAETMVQGGLAETSPLRQPRLYLLS